ncbi:MAG: DUF1559 domain-containing protein [Planctomycetia bacterium]|nr:DUF1559 domain-containing protein [Planctomycetia bacterium]
MLVPDGLNTSLTTPYAAGESRSFWPVRNSEWVGATGLLVACIFWIFCIPLGDSQERKRALPQCFKNIKQVALAIANYESVHNSLPPAYVADEHGRPMHSWRVLILPHLSEQGQEIYDQYRFDEPWNGPNNAKLALRCPDVYRCPECVRQNGRAKAWMTNYVAVVGPETAWPGERALKSREMTDGTTTTILVVEVADSGINWLEPRDLKLADMMLTINGPSGNCISSAHTDCARVGFADGHVNSLSNSLNPETVRALLTRNGGERVEDF